MCGIGTKRAQLAAEAAIDMQHGVVRYLCDGSTETEKAAAFERAAKAGGVGGSEGSSGHVRGDRPRPGRCWGFASTQIPQRLQQGQLQAVLGRIALQQASDAVVVGLAAGSLVDELGGRCGVAEPHRELDDAKVPRLLGELRDEGVHRECGVGKLQTALGVDLRHAKPGQDHSDGGHPEARQPV